MQVVNWETEHRVLLLLLHLLLVSLSRISPVGVIFFLIIAVARIRLAAAYPGCTTKGMYVCTSTLSRKSNNEHKEKRGKRKEMEVEKEKKKKLASYALSFLLLGEAKVWHFSSCQQTSSPTGNCQVFFLAPFLLLLP